ncbi:hypothetical protein HYX01_01280 [Candidatus Woesearchaeota archaeon]|nr:hypothetical protein [Candidatus Woesearchaeota archaeon]
MIKKGALLLLGLFIFIIFLLPSVAANSYTTDLSFVTSKTIYTPSERIELRGIALISNFSSNGTVISNRTSLINATLNVSIINKNTNATDSVYELNTTTAGIFYSRSDFYPSAQLISAPSTTAQYYIKVSYTDPNSRYLFVQTEIQVMNKTVDKLFVSSDKLSYRQGENVTIQAESIREVGDHIAYVANVTVNITIWNSNKTVVSFFNCTTGETGKCSINSSAPSQYGKYIVEVNNFKGFSVFEVTGFDIKIFMKDELGKSIKYTFDKGEQASIEVVAVTNNNSDVYSFNGTIKNSAGTVMKNITTTNLYSNNSFTNRFAFTLDALNFVVDNYKVDINITKTNGVAVGASTSFRVRSWNLLITKKEVNSNFEYSYSVFPNKTIYFQVYPTWRVNGSTILDINTTTSINVSVVDNISAKNITGDTNLSDAKIASLFYMNGTEYGYTQKDSFDLVNASNSVLEWAWNTTLQRFKLDTPPAGGFYTIQISGQNDTIATQTRFIVNPFNVCVVAKNTAGQAGGTTGYYYVYQFKTSDTIYLELKITQANNPSGRAATANGTNTSYGKGSACSVDTQSQQVVSNATITVSEVMNIQTGKIFPLNTTETTCQSDDNQGGYTCTIKPAGLWDGGSYGIKLKVVSQDAQTSDIAYAGFDARALYIYAWSSNWQNRPTSNITLNVYMYEAGDNWWSNYGSGGLSGTVSIEKVEYKGKIGEWLSTPINYGYNVSKINTTTITNGQASMILPVNYTPAGTWKIGEYRAILKGTDSQGNVDYGYAYFGIKRWETYASPVECSASSCVSTYNINSKSNISLYVTINNAGEWGQGGTSLGGDVVISVKKIQDCRGWPCKDLNSSKYNSTLINVSSSSTWYWSIVNKSYVINITSITGSWGTGYWQVLLDVNETESGMGWFNTIAFYAEAKPTDENGTNWKYSIKNNEPQYFNINTVKSQKSGYYYGSYNVSDYINTTIQNAVLRRWDQTTGNIVEYKYNTDINVTIVGGGTVINGTRVVNVTRTSGSWTSGYYWGELTLANDQNETATAWLWFQVRPFRVETTRNQYEIDSDACINGTMSIYDPDWRVSTILNATYNITGVTETTWTMSGSSLTTYTTFSPSRGFNGNTSFGICPNNNKWGSGSWGNYHYLTIKIIDNASNAEDGWLSFRTIPFSIKWLSIVGGTDVMKSGNVQIPVNITKASSGANASANLSVIYQWRWEDNRNIKEFYNFSAGSCDTRTAGTVGCKINGTQITVTIYPPSAGWREGYNYLQTEWTEYDDASSKIQDTTGIWFNGKSVYNGWWNNVDENGNYKYFFSAGENLTIKLYVRNSSNNVVSVNVTKVEYTNPTTNCWSEYCRAYINASFSILNQSTQNLTDNAIIKITKPDANWSRGYIYIRATLSGSSTETIKNGNVYVKDTNAPIVVINSPPVGTNITTSTFHINWTTSESATCGLELINYAAFNAWYCSNVSNSSSVFYNYCNSTTFTGLEYYYEHISSSYRSWNGRSWGWTYGTTGLVTGGTSHYYLYTVPSDLVNQDYGIRIYCYDIDWNSGINYSAFNINISTTASNTTNVTLLYPSNNSIITTATVDLNYSFKGPGQANCSLYANFTGSWLRNLSENQIANGSHNFTVTLSNGTFLWNVNCVDSTNSSNDDWGDVNRTFAINTTSTTTTTSNTTNVTLLYPLNGSTTRTALVDFNYTFRGPALANCSLYTNMSSSGTWLLNATKYQALNGTNNFTVSLRNGTYLWNVNCVDSGNSSNSDWADSNFTFTLSDVLNVTLLYPTNNSVLTVTNLTYNFSFSGRQYANCSLYTNVTGLWTKNVTGTNLSSGINSLNQTNLSSGRYVWNINCIDYYDVTSDVWAMSNYTYTKS